MDYTFYQTYPKWMGLTALLVLFGLILIYLTYWVFSGGNKLESLPAHLIKDLRPYTLGYMEDPRFIPDLTMMSLLMRGAIRFDSKALKIKALMAVDDPKLPDYEQAVMQQFFSTQDQVGTKDFLLFPRWSETYYQHFSDEANMIKTSGLKRDPKRRFNQLKT